MIYSIGYPKSGNTWIKYICATLLGLEYDNIHTQNEWPGEYLMSHAVKDSEVFCHLDKLITPVRDYKECVISYRAGCDIEKLRDVIGKFYPGAMNYIRPLRIYDSWPKDRRLMVYYEDLITMPEKTIGKIAYFIGVRNGEFSEFMNKIDVHKSKCLADYNMDCKESKSHGNHIDYWKNHLTDTEHNAWDKLVMETEPELFGKYLGRYGYEDKGERWFGR